MANWKVYQYLAEVLVETDGNVRLSQDICEVVIDRDQAGMHARLSQTIIEYIKDIVDRNARLTQVIIEVAYKNPRDSGNPGDYLDEAAGADFAW